jgi:hypothetical protein
MNAESFCAWLLKSKLSDRAAARELGCSRNSIVQWRANGAPRYVALACAAILAGLEPYEARP